MSGRSTGHHAPLWGVNGASIKPGVDTLYACNQRVCSGAFCPERSVTQSGVVWKISVYIRGTVVKWSTV